MSLNSFDVARQNMINSQLRPNRLTDDRVADAIEKVSREIFVPEDKRGVAYMDEDIHLGHGRYIMEPITFAKLVQDSLFAEHELLRTFMNFRQILGENSHSPNV